MKFQDFGWNIRVQGLGNFWVLKFYFLEVDLSWNFKMQDFFKIIFWLLVLNWRTSISFVFAFGFWSFEIWIYVSKGLNVFFLFENLKMFEFLTSQCWNLRNLRFKILDIWFLVIWKFWILKALKLCSFENVYFFNSRI